MTGSGPQNGPVRSHQLLRVLCSYFMIILTYTFEYYSFGLGSSNALLLFIGLLIHIM